MDHLRSKLAEEGLGQMGPHKHIIDMASKYGNVFEEKPRWKPDVKSQKEQIQKFMDTYSKIVKLE